MVKSYVALIVGSVALIYWARVLQLVVRTRRRHGASANFLPPEKLGLALRALWIPAVMGWIAIPLWLAFKAPAHAWLRPLFLSPALQRTAAGIAVVCLVLTWICWKKMGKSWRMGINPKEKTQLIITGPYAYVRHPIYALSTVLMLATMVAAPAPLLLLCGVIHLLFLQWESRREERYLVSVHGEIYDRYRRAVGGFVPRSLRPHVPESRG